MTIPQSCSDEAWRQALLSPEATLQAAIKNLSGSSLQIAMVVARDDVLLGTVTDGDIRRGLLRGLNLDCSINSITFRDPFVVPPHLGREMILRIMQVNKIRQIPIVDSERRVVGLHVWDELLVPTVRSNLIVIMAGGQGTRLRPQTENCPKPMLPVGGKPILEHIIERARGEGFHRFILAIHYLGEMIEGHFGDGNRWQVEIEYLKEKSPLGTAGALSLLTRRPGAPFIVLNGDVLTDVKYSEFLDFHSTHRAVATMAVRQHEWQHPFGVVRTKGVDIVSFEEKPINRTHINAGIYALDPEALDVLKIGELCDMPTLFSRLQEQAKRTIVYPMHEPWLDVGRPEDLERAHDEQLQST